MMIKLSKTMCLFNMLIFSLSIILLSGADTISVAGDNKQQKHSETAVPKKKPAYNSIAPKPVFDDKPINPEKPKKSSSSYKNTSQKKKTYNTTPTYKKKKVIHNNNTMKKSTYPPKRKPVKKTVEKKIK